MSMVVLPKWSYSSFNCYQICPLQFFHRYVAKDVPYKETAAMTWGNKVHNALDARISAGRQLPVDMAKWEKWGAAFQGRPVRTELRVGVRQDGTVCDFYADDCSGHMKIDLLYEPGDHTARLFDWKTGKVREDPFELRLQALFVQSMNPELRHIFGWYVWLGEGAHGMLGQKHDLSDVEKTWAEVDSMTNTINNNATINHWPERPGPMCAYCPVPKSMCRHNRNKDQ